MDRMIDEAQLEYLGDIFVHEGIQERYNVTFSQFVQMSRLGTWKQYKESKERGPVVTQRTIEEVAAYIDHIRRVYPRTD